MKFKSNLFQAIAFAIILLSIFLLSILVNTGMNPMGLMCIAILFASATIASVPHLLRGRR